MGRRFPLHRLFCDWDEGVRPQFDKDEKWTALAEAHLVYNDGTEHVLPIRRRFEVSQPSIFWGHLCYTSLPHLQDSPRKLTDPLDNGTEWGYQQYGLRDGRYPAITRPKDGSMPALLWVWAAENPDPSRPLKALRLEAVADDPLLVCGLTLYRGRENPLRVEPIRIYRIALPELAAEAEDRWKVEVDLGVVARSYPLREFNSETWLAAPGMALLGEWTKPQLDAVEGGAGVNLKNESSADSPAKRYLYAEVTANPDATLWLRDMKTGAKYEFDLAQAVMGKELEGKPAAARIEVIERDRTWVRGQVVDSATGRPTPVRLAFRSKEGRYIPPYGHRREINDGWFQDYGADLES